MAALSHRPSLSHSSSVSTIEGRLAVGHAFSYLGGMAVFPKPSSPLAAFRDLAAFMRQRSREQVIGGALAVLVTTIIVILFLVDPKINTAPPPQVVEVELYPANRTDAQIAADQKKDMAEQQAAKKERQRQFQQLGKQFGIE